MTADSKSHAKAALDRVTYWNGVYKSTNPTTAGNVGLVISVALPTLLYNTLPAPTAGCDKLRVLLGLQLLPACIMFLYVVVTGLQRIPVSPAAAHDPAAAYVAGEMPMKVHAANRAFVNTLEQYALLLSTTLALVPHLPCERVVLLPTLYITWSLCRVMYLFGYIRDGSSRMLGFPGTVMPTLAALCYALVLIVQSGSLY